MSSATMYPAYPARMDQSLSGWLWLVKWRLLALPHYLIVAIFSGSTWASMNRVSPWTGARDGWPA